MPILYGLDSNGGIISQTNGLGGVTTTFTHNPVGWLLTAQNPVQKAAGKATTYGYDQANRFTSITDQNASGATLLSYGSIYDAADRVTQETRTWASGASSDTIMYGYTNNNQLTSVTHSNAAFANESFSYDANGNRTGTGYTTAAGNELTASPGYPYTYNKAGQMVTATQTLTGDVWTYTYNFRGRLTSAVEKDSSGTVLESQSFVHDPFDNRIETVSKGVVTWKLLDGSSGDSPCRGAAKADQEDGSSGDSPSRGVAEG